MPFLLPCCCLQYLPKQSTNACVSGGFGAFPPYCMAVGLLGKSGAFNRPLSYMVAHFLSLCIYVNKTNWPHLGLNILLYFAHGSEVRKAN